ncbi:conserved hypothetical protein [Shewanella woodyi ATCC 51908]|uniref:TPR repeat-containing protein n=2 Tax=Shewanella woodyi TaxID=60961 RepID=B1KGE1_SHEWM|nr:conserved hypothetical protein [Shewanella woodyi ATCC 51908]
MSKKVLKKYTTIPSNLYVEREADRQLTDIIEEMQRPGYVLVARQMGKTNLLFNARRNLETNDRKFVYIDLSNNFETERECYNYITDSILDVLEDELWEIRPEIEEIRKITRTDHSSYTRSLSKILKCLGKDLVIILDEIDALRTSGYSDNIFAVIRSNYFTRSNFPEFEHLTYILSGVIEPKDLIKDRNKSPFNIGEKIYLEDFSKSEFDGFIVKSKLDISKEVADHIYSWTAGNPRLTFDVCSEIESEINSGFNVNELHIDNLIKKKYLTSFDIAPIDHIRELVSDNKEIQDAVTQLLSKEGSINISDKIKSQLYLYGIISSENNIDNIKIKNKIIELSLSLSWIKSLSDNTQTILDRAITLVEVANDYHQAIELLYSILDKIDDRDLTIRSLALYYLGFSEHSIGEYEKSNKHFLEKQFSKNASPFMHFRQCLFIGLNYYKLGKKDLGDQQLQYVVDNYSNTVTWGNAALNLAMNNENKESSLKLLESIVDMNDNIQPEVDSETETKSSIKKIKSYAYYYLSTYIEKDSKILGYLEKAIKLDVNEHIPFLMLVKGRALKNDEKVIIENIIDYIINKQVSFSDLKSSSASIDYSYNMHASFAALCFLHSIDNFDKFKDYSINYLNLLEESFFHDALQYIGEPLDRINFIEFYLDKLSNLSSIRMYRLYINCLMYVNHPPLKYREDYINAILDKGYIEDEDIPNISLLIKISTTNEPQNITLGYIESIKKLAFNIDESIGYDSSVIFFWAFEFFNSINDTENKYLFGHEVLKRLNMSKSNKTVIDDEGEKSLKSRVMSILHKENALPPLKPVKRQHNYGRNDLIKVKYRNGEEKTNKFKRLEKDIKSGDCTIIE